MILTAYLAIALLASALLLRACGTGKYRLYIATAATAGAMGIACEHSGLSKGEWV